MRFRDFHKNVKTRIYVLFAFGTVQATTFPFMAIYFAKHFGETMTGALLTLSIVASMVSGAFGGYYADRIGRRKLMIMSESIFLFSYLLMAFANSAWINSPTITFIAFFITNVCWGIYGPADEAMLLDVTNSENRQLMYSIFYWVHNLTMAVGASIGAVFFETHRFELFTCMSIVVFCSLMATVFRIEETYFPSDNIEKNKLSSKGIIHNYMAVLKDSTFVVYILAGVLVMSVEFQMSNYIGIRLAKEVVEQPLIYLKELVINIDGVKLLGFLQTENTILVVLFAGLMAKIIKRYPDKRILFFGISLYTIGYSVLTVSNTPLILFAGLLIATIGEVLEVPIRQSYLGDIAPSHARSSYVAVNGMTFSGARILASLGVIIGAHIPSWGMGVITLIAGFTGFLLLQSIVPAVHVRRQSEASISANV